MSALELLNDGKGWEEGWVGVLDGHHGNSRCAGIFLHKVMPWVTLCCATSDSALQSPCPLFFVRRIMWPGGDGNADVGSGSVSQLMLANAMMLLFLTG